VHRATSESDKNFVIDKSVRKHKALLIIIIALHFFSYGYSFSQVDTTVHLTFDFDDQQINEKKNKSNPKYAGITLTYDRFGNKESALQLNGHPGSYLNLGTSELFKNPNMSISFWVKVNNRVYAGKGYDGVILLGIKNGPGFDFTNAFVIGYDNYSRKLAINSTKDSTQEVSIYDNDTIEYNRWYHIVGVCNNNYLALYVDGKLVGKEPKHFETKFLENDSMVIGHTASTKNERYMRGVVDDIHIFHRPLSYQEVLDLYNAPNPNRLKSVLNEVLKYGAIVLVFIIIIIVILYRNKRNLKLQKEQLELTNKISELELKALKSQMNPHFISNCLVAIQELVYKSENKRAGLYIARFSYFIRQILNYSDQNYITLTEELDLIKLYAELEQIRFKDGFDFSLILDETINSDEILIPSLITQPFVENAIWHGILPLNNIRPGKLFIHVLLKNDLPVIEIEDNGNGRKTKIPTNRKSKGIKLVLDKIEALNRLSQNNHYKINIIDLIDNKGEPLGTKVIIQLEYLNE
jgi:hypothetical protein